MTTIRHEDPVVISARREAGIVLGLWLVAGTWSISFSFANGYERQADEITYILGFPAWVFWGVVAPWVLCAALSLVISLGIMRDGELGDDEPAGPEDAHG